MFTIQSPLSFFIMYIYILCGFSLDYTVWYQTGTSLNLGSCSVDSPRGRSTRSCGGFSWLLQAPVINSCHAIHLGLVQKETRKQNNIKIIYIYVIYTWKLYTNKWIKACKIYKYSIHMNQIEIIIYIQFLKNYGTPKWIVSRGVSFSKEVYSGV